MARSRYRKFFYLPLQTHHVSVAARKTEPGYPSEGQLLVFRDAIAQFVAEQPVIPFDISADDGDVLVYRDSGSEFAAERPAVPVSVASNDGDILVYRTASLEYVAESPLVPVDIAAGDITGVPLVWDDTAGQYVPADTLELYDDLRVPVSSVKTGGAKDPQYVQVRTDGAGSQGVYAYVFDKSVEEELFFAVQIPHTWVEGTTIYPHVHWFPITANAGKVAWKLEYTWASIGAVFGNTAYVSGVADAPGVAFQHTMTHLGVAGIDGTGKTASSMLMCRIFRDATNVPDDTLDEDAALIEIDFHYQVGRLGEAFP